MMLAAGLMLLIAWPIYNVLLVAYSVRNTRANRARIAEAAQWTAPASRLSPAEFWIIVPCLNEERVVGRTVRAALDLAGPAGTSTHVLVVDDGSDDGTPGVVTGIEHPNLHVLRRELPHARQGKGEALNAGYRYIRDRAYCAEVDARRVVVGVIDGDGRGSANMLTEVAYELRDPEISAVQCRVRIHNRDRVLGAVQDLEFGCIANASQVLRNRLGTVGLGGNGQFVRLSALSQLGDAPWSACLVEDLELGLRIHLAGGEVRYSGEAYVTQQGLVDVGRLLRQRTRWAQGNLQCATYVPQLIRSRRISNSALLEMLYYLLAPWVNAGGTVAIAGLWGYAVWRLLPGHGPTFIVGSWGQLGVALASWIAALLVPGLLWVGLHRWELRDERLSRCLLAALVYPAFLLLGLVSTWRAIARQCSGRQSWTKTERLADETDQPAELVLQT